MSDVQTDKLTAIVINLAVIAVIGIAVLAVAFAKGWLTW